MRLAAIVLAALALPGHAQIAGDGTLGTSISRSGSSWSISAGTRVGGNLFHSFSQFGVPTLNTATFSGPNSVVNIIGRVTGPNGSSIDGTLRSTIPGANLWLINPHGVAFGPNASLDIGGSFHVSTADYLKLGTSGQFNATNPGASVLTSAPPSAFGFVGSTVAPINISGATISIADGKALSFVGGNLSFSNATVSANGGRINLASVAGPGEVTLTSAGITSTASAFGQIDLTGTTVRADSGGQPASGSVRIRGGQLAMADSFVTSDNSGALDGGGIAIELSGALRAEDSQIAARGSGAGNAGDIVVTAENIELLSGSQVGASSFGAARAGDTKVTATGALTIAGENGSGHASGIFSSAETGSTGDAGKVTVRAGTLSMEGGSAISSLTRGPGRAGEIDVATTGQLTISGGSTQSYVTGIYSSAEDSATGNAGNVTVRADSLLIQSGGTISADANTSTSANGGTVTVTARDITLLSGATVGSATYGAGRAGDTHVTATGRLKISGQMDGTYSGIYATSEDGASGDAGNVVVHADTLRIEQGGTISADALTTGGPARGGTVTVTARDIALLSGATVGSGTYGTGRGGDTQVTAQGRLKISGELDGTFSGIYGSSEEGASGDAGNVTVRAGTLLVEKSGSISVDANTTDGPATAGTVTVTAREIILREGGDIRSATFGAGRGGDINVTVGSLTVSGVSPDGVFRSGILAYSNSTGDAGNVMVRADTLRLEQGGGISASSFGAGKGGTVSVEARGDLSIAGKGVGGQFAGIFATALGTGRAGNLKIAAGGLRIDEGGAISAETDGPGNAGNVTVVATGDIALRNGGAIQSSTYGSSGHAGDVEVSAGGTLSMFGRSSDGFATGIFSTSSRNAGVASTGNAGSLTVRAPSILIGNGGAISAISVGSGHAGTISVTADTLKLVDGGSITTSAESSDGGDIVIQAGQLVYLKDSKITTSVNTSTGAGGNIVIDPTFVILDHSKIIAQAAQGRGGNITIVSDFFLNFDSIVDASSQNGGVSGSVVINSPNVNVGSGVVVLGSGYLDASSLIRASCANRARSAESSSFTGVGRGGLAAGPHGGAAAGAVTRVGPVVSLREAACGV